VGRSWTTWKGKRLIVHGARVVPNQGDLSPGEIQGQIVGTSDGALELVLVQPEGKPVMSATEWARGARVQPGDHLGP
jgi:methionyl-tRNA formyltransferase